MDKSIRALELTKDKPVAFYLPFTRLYYCETCIRLPADVIAKNSQPYNFETVFTAMHNDTIKCSICELDLRIEKSIEKPKKKKKESKPILASVSFA